MTIMIAATGVVINAVALGFVGIQVILARRQLSYLQETTETEVVRRKRQSTIDFYMATIEHIGDLRVRLPNDWEGGEIAAFISRAFQKGAREDIFAIARYLSYFEAVAVGVTMDVYDLKVINELAGSRILALANNYVPFFERRREEVGSNTPYENLQTLGSTLARLRGM